MSSVRNRLALLFFAITAAAVGFVYIYVVPQLSSSLTAERLSQLERRGIERDDRLDATIDAEVDETVALIQRQIAVAGLIALLASLGAGWLVAGAHSRRLRRLEAAAQKIADGDFTNPIEVDSSDEVGQLAISFNEMQQRLATLDSARREFIANASHELRTPIFSLSGLIELLEDDDPDPETRAEFIRTMREQLGRLRKLTVDLLDLSKLDAGGIEMRRERVELDEVARRVAAEFGPAAERHGSAIEVGPGGHVAASADPDRVAQIMRILIDNALTHTPEGTAIAVGTEVQNGSARLVVADDGPGIDAGSRRRVFERFYTGDRVGGSGLGLAIARELVLRMDGSIDLRSDASRTEFEVRLPVAAPVGG
jgi:two-component system, OmpR family, sensor kinase